MTCERFSVRERWLLRQASDVACTRLSVGASRGMLRCEKLKCPNTMKVSETTSRNTTQLIGLLKMQNRFQLPNLTPSSSYLAHTRMEVLSVLFPTMIAYNPGVICYCFPNNSILDFVMGVSEQPVEEVLSASF